MPKVMKKKINLSFEEVIESHSHMKFTAIILIDDRIVNMESVGYYNNDMSKYLQSVDELKRKYECMYQDLLNYREKYKIETMRVSLDFSTSHSVDNLPF